MAYQSGAIALLGSRRNKAALKYVSRCNCLRAGARCCAVKVKLTIALASGGNLLVSRAFHPSRISGESVAPGVEQIGRCAGRGGVFLRGPRAGRPTVTEREGFLRALPHCFLFLVLLWEAPRAWPKIYGPAAVVEGLWVREGCADAEKLTVASGDPFWSWVTAWVRLGALAACCARPVPASRVAQPWSLPVRAASVSMKS
jgi:hypothetical protein